MNLRALTVFLSIISLSALAFSIWAIQLSQGGHFLVRFAMIATGNFLLLVVYWMSYSLYAMYWLVPKVDAIVDPELRKL